MRARLVLACLTATTIATSGCSTAVDGQPVALTVGSPPGVIDMDEIVLGQAQMRAVTDSAALTPIPGMNGTAPADIPELTEAVPPPCRFVFSDTATFGPDRQDFRKTGHQITPPHPAMISVGGAAYAGPTDATKAFITLRTAAIGCADTPTGGC